MAPLKIDIFLLSVPITSTKNLVRHAKVNCPCDVNNYCDLREMLATQKSTLKKGVKEKMRYAN